MTNSDELAKLEAERAELIAKNKAATSWGAAVGVRSERIKELDNRISLLRRLASSEGGVKGEPGPVAWQYELADSREWSNGEPGQYTGWHERLSKTKPNVPEGSIRNLTPLYTAPPADAGMRDALAYAERLAIALWSKHFKENAPEWKPLSGNLIGLLTQIDNMTVALTATGATTKSDGGVEGHAGENDTPATKRQANQSETTVGIKPGPSDTTPSTRSEVTVEGLADHIYETASANLWKVVTHTIARALLDQFEIRRK